MSNQRVRAAIMQHRINIVIWANVALGVGYLAMATTMWFTLTMIIPLTALWFSTRWISRGGFVLASGMSKTEQLKELKAWKLY